MKVYSLKNKCFSNHKSLSLQTEEEVKHMIVGMPKSSSTKIETLEKSIGGTLLNSLDFNTPSKNIRKGENIKFIF